ncbi:helix-turn-helix domain-containing protein [Rhizocola hellebori]|nr:helix-turn-helix transcriptional regulator [Rhizocola hellebori]
MTDLGAFLRGRREAVTPAQVGLPTSARRRTPGLRRAELAILAGVSVEYLTRLEQGRDRHPSMQVLAALADALGLSAQERLHLRGLAKVAGGGGGLICAGLEPPAREVRPTVQALLLRLEPAPAYVANRLTDVLAYTSGFERLAGPVGLLDADPPNLARYTFADTRARNAYPQWDLVADERAATLATAIGPDDPHRTELVDELTVVAGASFAARLAAATVPNRTGTERFTHPQVGELRLAYETLDLPDADGQSLVVYLPADDATSTALDQLNGRRPGALRPVPHASRRSA